MNSITVTVELCAEDRARLDSILEALKQPHVSPATKHGDVIIEEHVQLAQAVQEAPVAAAEEKPTKNPPEAEKPAEAAPAPTEAELRSLVQKLVASGQRDAVKAIVQQYAARVSDVPEDKRAECIEQLKALEVKA